MILTHLVLFSFFDGAGGATPPPPVVVTTTGTGGIDPGEGIKRRRTIYKPTGLVDRTRKPEVERRIEQADEVAREVTREMRERFTEPIVSRETVPPISAMTMLEIDEEIGIRLRAQQQMTEDEEILLLLTMI